jgi:hypothetical protein
MRSNPHTGTMATDNSLTFGALLFMICTFSSILHDFTSIGLFTDCLCGVYIDIFMHFAK